MNRFGIYIFFAFMINSGIIFGQKNKDKEEQEDTCSGKYDLANTYYKYGDFDIAIEYLERYQRCMQTKDSRYFKLKIQIYIVQEKQKEADSNMVCYINSKFENYYTDDDPPLFKDLFNKIQDSLALKMITSLSKRQEDINLAAATVIVIKESDFKTRGYTDIIDLLSDQPGFDISKINAVTYANVYQRGFRQENTERTLFLIDGIEENDIWSNIAYMSRQYPLSNIRAVEIIYGPASTIYGPRAFAGTINIITKTPKDLIRNYSSQNLNKLQFGITAKALQGSFNTKGMDINMSGIQKNISFFLTGRFFKTDGNNLSNTSFFDYNPNDLDLLDYKSDKLKTLSFKDNPLTTINELDTLTKRLALVPGSKNYNYFTGYGTGNLKVNADSLQQLIARARQIDKNGYNKIINGNPVGFSNGTNHYYIGGKVKVWDLVVGFRTWKSQESFNYYSDLFTAGTKNGSQWAPINTTFYTNYTKKFDNLIITNSSSYAIHGLDKSSNLVSYNSFYDLLNQKKYSNLSVFNLIFPDSLINGNKSGWKNTYYYYKARQFRNDLKVNYTNKNKKVNLLVGLDIRSSQLQGDYLKYVKYAGSDGIDQTSISLAQDKGTVTNQDSGNNQYNTLDMGLYSQLSVEAIPKRLYLTLGAREDKNRIRSNRGFGYKGNPKLAVVYAFPNLIFKGIYSQGIQNPSQFTKYATTSIRILNDSLQPEKIYNTELVIQNQHGSTFDWDVEFFHSKIKKAVALLPTKNDPTKYQNVNVGTYVIYGVQGNVNYSPKAIPISFYLNLSILNAEQTDEVYKNKTIGDIANFKSNMGMNINKSFGTNELNLNLRGNYIGVKNVGGSTTVDSSFGVNGTSKIPAYFICHTSITYHNTSEKLKFITLQFTINNLLNKTYYSPGPRTADFNSSTGNYNGYVPYIPQPNRNFILTLNFQL